MNFAHLTPHCFVVAPRKPRAANARLRDPVGGGHAALGSSFIVSPRTPSPRLGGRLRLLTPNPRDDAMRGSVSWGAKRRKWRRPFFAPVSGLGGTAPRRERDRVASRFSASFQRSTIPPYRPRRLGSISRPN